jgi:hypothetical protein
LILYHMRPVCRPRRRLLMGTAPSQGWDVRSGGSG